MRDIFESDTLKLPDINVGDEVMVGKFKNRKAIVKGFDKDDHNQPVLKTTKGDQKLFKPRISKLMKEKESITEHELIDEESVISSWIDDLTYDYDNTEIIMTLQTGRSYIIHDAPEEVYDEWMAAPSHGKFWHSDIRDQYSVS